MRLIRSLLIGAIIATLASAQDLSSLKRIHVGNMGQSDESARFRFLLMEQLSKLGFDTSDTSENADAVLAGVLIVRVFAETLSARATVVLTGKDGTRLWGGDFQPRSSIKRGYVWQKQDSVDYRAEDIAKDLRKACDKARSQSLKR